MTDEESTPPAFDWNRQQTDEQEQIGLRIMQLQFPRLDRLEKQLDDQALMEADPRSSLALDDPYLGMWRNASMARGALGAAWDSLNTVRLVVGEPEPSLPMTGLYPILRAGIENASLVIFLTSPEKRDERLERFYRVAAEEVEYQHKFNAQFNQEESDRIVEKNRQQIADLIAARGLALNPRKLPPAKHFDIVTRAAADIAALPGGPASRDIPLPAMWQILSGLAHAKHWAMVAALERSMAVPDPADHSATVRLTSSATFTGYSMLRAVDTVEAAMRYYLLRSRAFTAQPEDAFEPH